MVKKIVQLRRKKPEFHRVNYIIKRLKDSWRKPKDKQGRRKKVLKNNKGPSPKEGYKMPKSIRGLHPSGYKIIEVENIKQLDKINPEVEGIKIRKVGRKKKIEIIKYALEKNIKILNVRNPERYLEAKK